MPNWCFNRLSVKGDNDKVDEFIGAVNTNEGIQILESLIPRPEDVEDWYQWSLDNWGTKWGDREARMLRENEWTVFLFDTAWSPPIEGITRISAMFPDLTFVLVYEEGGMCFMGGERIEKGVVVLDVDCPYPDGPDDPDDEDGWDAMGDKVFEKLNMVESTLRGSITV